jgi:hypothetical protein
VKWLTNLFPSGRIEEPGTASIRAQASIEQEDERVFHPFTLREALRVARLIRDDEALSPKVRALAEVGVVLDLMPGHLMPRRHDHAVALGVTVRTIRRRAIRWEGVDQRVKFYTTQIAARAIIAERGAKLR